MSLDESIRTAPVAIEAELALYRNRVSALEAEIATIQARLLTKLAVESHEVQALIAAAQSDLEYSLNVLERDYQVMMAELQAVRAALDQSMAGERILRAEKDMLLVSFSWKVTRPLRGLARRLPLLHRVVGRLIGLRSRAG